MFSFLKKVYTQTQTVSVPDSSTIEVEFNFNPEKPLFVKSLDITLGTSTTIDFIKIDEVNVGTNANNDFESRFGELPAVERVIKISLTNSDTNAHDTTLTLEGVKVK